MNGPDHYRLAESLLELADSPAGRAMKADGYDPTAEAQVHATLALAAVTWDAAAAACATTEGPPATEALVQMTLAWDEVTS